MATAFDCFFFSDIKPPDCSFPLAPTFNFEQSCKESVLSGAVFFCDDVDALDCADLPPSQFSFLSLAPEDFHRKYMRGHHPFLQPSSFLSHVHGGIPSCLVPCPIAFFHVWSSLFAPKRSTRNRKSFLK